MASTGKESFKQDLVVSIRYRNELPPPPMPPKLLDIDTGGISQYLTTSYASSLARREEPNIDADAEGGMPIDMIGLPGYFLGDESAIMAPDTEPILDPADQALMMTVDQLKSQGARSNVSFLRKNLYLSSQNTRTGEPLKSSTPRPKPINRAPLQDRNDKETMKKHIQKGFDIAYPESIPYNPPETKTQPSTDAERKAWKEPKHPDNFRLKPVAIYPVLPDLETGTDAGNWGRVKFEKPPVAAHHGRRDARVDSALFMAVPNKEAEEIWQRKKEAYDRDPENYDDPGPSPPYTYIMTLPQTSDSASTVRRVLAGHSDAENPSIREQVFEETEDGTFRIPFNRARIYPTVQQTAVHANRFMALGLYDPDSPANTLPPSKGKRNQGPAAYFYPISENLRFKTDRSKLSKPSKPDEEEEEVHIDRMMVGLAEPNVNQLAERALFRGKFDDSFKEEWDQMEVEAKKWRDALEDEQGQQDVAMVGGEQDNDEGLRVNGGSRMGKDSSAQSVEASRDDGNADAMDDD